MQKNSYSFNNFSIDEAMKLAQSEAGQRLLSLLQETKGDALRTAMDQEKLFVKNVQIVQDQDMFQVKRKLQYLFQQVLITVSKFHFAVRANTAKGADTQAIYLFA